MSAKTNFAAAEELKTQFFLQIPAALAARRDLDWTDKAVWIILADYTRTCDEVFVSKATICEKTGVGRTTVTKSLLKLQELGYLKCKQRAGTSNLFYLRAIAYNGLPLTRPESDRGAAGIRPTTRPESGRDTEQVIENKEPSSAAADPIDLTTCKQPYRSVASEMRKTWIDCSPGKRYAFAKADGSILKKIWDDCEDLAEVARVFSSAALRRESDPFWAKNWSVKFVYGQLSMLKNQSGRGAAGEVDESSRVVTGAYESVLSTCSLYGVGRDLARGVLRDGGLVEEEWCVPWLRKLNEGLTSRFWAQRFKREDRQATLRAAVRTFASGVPKRAAEIGGGIIPVTDLI